MKLKLFLLFTLFFYLNSLGQNSRPNIIFILTDDQRWDALGYVGNRFVSTPNMDYLAQKGVYFKNALVTTPICAASRASILSSMQERSHRYSFTSGPIEHKYLLNSYPKILKDNGYFTAFFGKFGINTSNKQNLFDVFDDYDRNVKYSDYRGYYYKTINSDTVHLTQYTGYQALNFLDSINQIKPFCLSLSFSAPHAHDPAEEQYFWTKDLENLLKNDTIPKAAISSDNYYKILPEIVKKGFNRLRWTWRFDTPEKYQNSVKGYYRMISGVDIEVGKILTKLKEKNLDKNTIIILMGDNGYFLGERQLAGKWLMYDNSLRVPLIIYDPKNLNHKDLDQLALNIDIAPTILEYAGINKPFNWHGKSLIPLINQSMNRLRDTVLIEHLWEFDSIPPSEGIKTTNWKYFHYVNDKEIEELYFLKEDPNEIQNLAKKPEYFEKLKEFRKTTQEMILKYEIN